MNEQMIQQRRKAYRRAWKYAFLSAFLTMVVLVSTGCAALLTGDNRKAYDLMVKAADYFYYPSSVQIVSGSVNHDNSMFCVIRAKNRYGSYRWDNYYVDSNGEPTTYYSSYCYAETLDYDLINNALASHFGISSSGSTGNVFSTILGGINMSSGWSIFLYIVILVVVLCLHAYLASNASDIAEEKGYEKRKWFHMCFWLGFIPFIIVAAMPDKQMRLIQSRTNQLLERQLESIKELNESTLRLQGKQNDEQMVLPEL